jgi:hypothetical protein
MASDHGTHGEREVAGCLLALDAPVANSPFRRGAGPEDLKRLVGVVVPNDEVKQCGDCWRVVSHLARQLWRRGFGPGFLCSGYLGRPRSDLGRFDLVVFLLLPAFTGWLAFLEEVLPS